MSHFLNKFKISQFLLKLFPHNFLYSLQYQIFLFFVFSYRTWFSTLPLKTLPNRKLILYMEVFLVSLCILSSSERRPNQTRPDPSVGSNRQMSTIRSLPSYTEPRRSPSLSVELSIYATFTERKILFRFVSSSDFPGNLNQRLNQRPPKPVRLGHLLTKREE